MRHFLLIACLALTACQSTPPKAQSVEKAWVRLAAVPANPSAAYFTLNGGPVADRLMTVTSPLAIRAEMHDMAMKGGMMSMGAIEGGLELSAGGVISFAPSGKHVMLFDVSPKVVAGGKMPLHFSFASGATLDADADVKAAGSQ
jgi:periplasmic copper chaperone A